jgi:hypothetical protein
MMAAWGRFYQEWRLGNVQSGRTCAEASLALLNNSQWSVSMTALVIDERGSPLLEQRKRLYASQDEQPGGGITLDSEKCHRDVYSLVMLHKNHWLPHMCATVNKLLGSMFSCQSTTKQYTESLWANKRVPVIRAWNLATCLWWQSQ